MAKEYNEFSFYEDIELMNLTYQMTTGNFTNDYQEEVLSYEEINQPKIGL